MELTKLIRKENYENLKKLIEENKDQVNEQDAQGATPLLAAIASGKPKVVELLLENGADPNFASENSTLPLIFAIDCAIEDEDYDEDVDEMPVDIIKILLKYGANIHKEDFIEESTPYEYSKGRHVVALEIFNQIKK